MDGKLVVLSRVTSSIASRNQIKDVNLKGDIRELRSIVCKAIALSENDFDLLYGGVKLEDNELVSAYNIKAGVVIHAVKRLAPPDTTSPGALSRSEVKDVVKTLQNALINPAYRNTVEKMLCNPETLESLIATTPSLGNDPVAIAMLQDPDLLGILADPQTIDKVIAKHPGLAQAAMFVTSALKEQRTHNMSPARRRVGASGHYSLDQMSDDEDMDTSQPITANQLASALAEATAQATPSTSSGGNPTTDNTNMSADFMRQALEQALGGTTQPQAQPVTESKLQQLREMGITDEAVARQALTAAAGDIQGALEIIFGEGL